MGEKRFSEGLLCAVLFVGVGFGVIAGAAIYASAYPIFQSERWAAWVQAIFTLVGIGAAWAAMNRQYFLQTQNENRRRDLGMAAKLEGVEALSIGLQGLIQGINGIVGKSGSENWPIEIEIPEWRRDVSARIKVLETIPLHEIPYAFVSVSIMRYMSEVHSYMDDIEELCKMETTSGDISITNRRYVTSGVFQNVGASYARLIQDSHARIASFRD